MVFDTGFTDSFLIHEHQLRRFAGLRTEHLRSLDHQLRAAGRQIPLYAANLWIHPNRPGERDQFATATPFLLEVHRGIGITNAPDQYPRLPLLGSRALRQGELQVYLDYQKCRVSVRTPRRFWIFG